MRNIKKVTEGVSDAEVYFRAKLDKSEETCQRDLFLPLQVFANCISLLNSVKGHNF
ncbi:hypothetical protein J6590_083300 [Homalodisca vitripennis]|nr:hypothetical protein J6590_083300 [Homalodisca vitripennis]